MTIEQHTLRGRKSGQQQLALIAMLVGVGAIAFSPIFARLSDVGPISAAFWRLALAVPLLLAWNIASPRDPVLAQPVSWCSHLWLLLPGLLFAADLAFWHWSIRLTSVANATFLPNMAPLLVSIAAWRFLGERLRPVFAVGLVTALVGVGLMVWASAGAGDNSVVGDMLGLLTAVSYSGYLLTIKHLRARYSTRIIMLAGAVIGSVVLFIVTRLTGETFWAAGLSGWLVLLGLAWFSHVGGQGMITYALAHLPAAFSSVMLLMQPVLSAMFAWIILGEAIGWLQGAGGALVVLGVALARRGSSA